MNIADPIVPVVRGQKRSARKMMTASQSTQLNADHGQEGTSTDSKPGLSFTTHSQMSMQAHACAVAAPITLPQDHYIRTPIQHKQANFQAQHHEVSNEEDWDNGTFSQSHQVFIDYHVLE